MKYSGAAPALSGELEAERGASDGTARAHPKATSATDTTLRPKAMMTSDYPIFFGRGAQLSRRRHRFRPAQPGD
jgi:hypothetical protein